MQIQSVNRRFSCSGIFFSRAEKGGNDIRSSKTEGVLILNQICPE